MARRHLLPFLVGAAISTCCAAVPPSFQVRNPSLRRRSRRNLLDIIPTFSVSQDGVDTVLPVMELQLFGTSGYVLSEEAYDTIQTAINMYLQDLLGEREWQNSTTKEAAESGNQNGDTPQPTLTNVRTEVLTDRALVGVFSDGINGVRHLERSQLETRHNQALVLPIQNNRSLKQQVLGNKLEIQTTLTFQDSAVMEGSEIPWQDAGLGDGNLNGEEVDYNTADVDDDTQSDFMPLQQELDAAFVEAFGNLSDSTFWAYLWTLINQGSASLQQEFESLQAVNAKEADSTNQQTEIATEEDNAEVDHHSPVNNTIATLNEEEEASSVQESQRHPIRPLTISLAVVLALAVLLTGCIIFWKCCKKHQQKHAISPTEFEPEIDSEDHETCDCDDIAIHDKEMTISCPEEADNSTHSSQVQQPEILKVIFPLGEKRSWLPFHAQMEHKVAIAM
jgi:hypothetical protein